MRLYHASERVAAGATGRLAALAVPRPRAVAHRGGRGLAPENTLAACSLALALGVDAIEVDVRLTADGVPILLHDPTLERTTDGRGPVGASRLAALRAWMPRRGAPRGGPSRTTAAARGRAGAGWPAASRCTSS